jgi:peptide/nickel transport system substrate-binding protein
MMRKRSQRWMIMLALALGGILLTGAGENSVAAPSGVLKQAIHWAQSADWLDPATNPGLISSGLPLYLLHDALVKPMPEGNYTPCLAESWTISPDAKTYEFKLRKGVKFHNGDPFTAEDVVFSFYRYKSSQAKIIQNKTEKVEAVNPYLVRFHFKVPFPDFLDYSLPGASGIFWIAPKKYIEKVGDAGFKKHPVGCGPYKFVEFVTGVKLIGEAFDDYWRKVPAIKRIEFHIVREPATRLVMVRRGEVDIATLMQGVFYEDVKKDPKLRLLHPLSPVTWLVYIGPQWDPKSPWADTRVRKAASLAIDRQSLADIFMPGGCKGMGSMAMEGDSFGVNFPPDPYDPAQAKKLLAEAGYPKGFHGGKFYPYEGGYWPYGEQIVNYWKAIGISMDTILLDRPAWFANRQGGKMKGASFIDPAPLATIGARLGYLFGSTSYGNYPDIEALWKQYQPEINQQKRKEIIGKIQNMIHERTMFIPLTNTNSPAAFGPRVKGNPYKIQPLIWFTAPFEDMELVQ